jgi:hypothetical protein
VSLSAPSAVISSRSIIASNELDVMRLAADISYPVPPEVGKVGKESPTFIQPVSERSDGIKSFFNKQSPAKSMVKAEPQTIKSSPSTRPKESVKDEVKEEQKVKADPEGIKSEITPKDEEKGLGDDSNAPNPDPSSDIEVVDSPDSKSQAKKEVKAENVEEKEEEEKEDLSTTLTKRKRDEKGGAGQRTKVIRRDDDSKSAVRFLRFFFHFNIAQCFRKLTVDASDLLRPYSWTWQNSANK